MYALYITEPVLQPLKKFVNQKKFLVILKLDSIKCVHVGQEAWENEDN